MRPSRLFRRAKATAIAVAVAAATLPILLTATPASACIVDSDGDCYFSVTGTVSPSNGLNVRTQPYGTVLDTLPYNYSGRTDCYVQASDKTYWDWIYDSRIGRSGWVADQYLYTGGNIYQQVDQMNEGNCAYFSLAAPVNVAATAIREDAITVTWTDQTGGHAQFVVNNGNVSSPTLAAGATSYTWTGLSPGQYMCFTVAAKVGGSQSSWSSYGCTSTPPLNWIASSSSNGSSPSDVINIIMSGDSTVSPTQIMTWLGADPLDWQQVGTPAVLLSTTQCMNLVYANISGSWRSQDLSYRPNGCNQADLLLPNQDHFRVWEYGNTWYIAASQEEPCLGDGITHCVTSYDTGRDDVVSAIESVIGEQDAANGWKYSVNIRQPSPYPQGSIVQKNGSTTSYSGVVDVVTVTG